MRAARYYGPGDIRIEEVDEPEVKPGEIKLKLAWCGICGSDLYAYKGGIPGISGETFPTFFGHEFSGTIVELGSGVNPWVYPVGRGACVNPMISCGNTRLGQCASCSRGEHNVCPRNVYLGYSDSGGGLAEYICVAAELVYPLPPGTSLEAGALVEPLAVAWHAVKQSGFKEARSDCLITGAGPIGLMILQILRAQDASYVAVSQPSPRRRALAASLGASSVFDPRTEDVPAAMRAATNGRGVDIVFECSGSQAALDVAIAAVRPRGRVVTLALWGDRAQVDMNAMMLKEVGLVGAIAYCGDHAEVVAALAKGKFKRVEKLITKRIELDDLVEEGIECLIKDKANQVKILVRVGS